MGDPQVEAKLNRIRELLREKTVIKGQTIDLVIENARIYDKPKLDKLLSDLEKEGTNYNLKGGGKRKRRKSKKRKSKRKQSKKSRKRSKTRRRR
jgi:hypothetical protein